MLNSVAVASLVDRIHSLAVKRGYWSDKKTDRCPCEILEGLHSELSEAWDEYQNDCMDLYWKKRDNHGIWRVRTYDSYYTPPLEMVAAGWKPVGYFTQLADLCIRIFDVAGAYGWDLAAYPDSEESRKLVIRAIQNRQGNFAQIHELMRTAISSMIGFNQKFYSSSSLLAHSVVLHCSVILEVHQVSVHLLDLLELKHSYNETKGGS